jgi:hypothetical protein
MAEISSERLDDAFLRWNREDERHDLSSVSIMVEERYSFGSAIFLAVGPALARDPRL